MAEVIDLTVNDISRAGKTPHSPGFFLLEKRGYASQAVSAISNWALFEMGLPKIYGITARENVASQIFGARHVQTFFSTVKKNYKAHCDVPKLKNVDGKINCPKVSKEAIEQHQAQDMATCRYEIKIPCKGNNGIAEIHVNAEVGGLLGLCDVDLTVSFKK